MNTFSPTRQKRKKTEQKLFRVLHPKRVFVPFLPQKNSQLVVVVVVRSIETLLVRLEKKSKSVFVFVCLFVSRRVLLLKERELFL